MIATFMGAFIFALLALQLCRTPASCCVVSALLLAGSALFFLAVISHSSNQPASLNPRQNQPIRTKGYARKYRECS